MKDVVPVESRLARVFLQAKIAVRRKQAQTCRVGLRHARKFGHLAPDSEFAGKVLVGSGDATRAGDFANQSLGLLFQSRPLLLAIRIL
jgi:hypothetical protein